VGFSPKLVVGVFVGFDDNRSLGEGRDGRHGDAVPIFIDFMQDALQGQPTVDFKPPKNAKFAMVRGIREAFRPGTEPRVEDRPGRSEPVPGSGAEGLPVIPRRRPNRPRRRWIRQEGR
jgi:penicillin-binding protein 1A